MIALRKFIGTKFYFSPINSQKKGRNKKMRKGVIGIAAICLLSISAYADYECESKYHEKLTKLKSLSGTEISKENKDKFISELEKAYQLCKEGQKEQASQTLNQLRKDKDFDTVFSTHDGN